MKLIYIKLNNHWTLPTKQSRAKVQQFQTGAQCKRSICANVRKETAFSVCVCVCMYGCAPPLHLLPRDGGDGGVFALFNLALSHQRFFCSFFAPLLFLSSFPFRQRCSPPPPEREREGGFVSRFAQQPPGQ